MTFNDTRFSTQASSPHLLVFQHAAVQLRLDALWALRSEIEAEHASTRIQQRETRGTFRTVNRRQRKQGRNNNPQSTDNQRPIAHTQGHASETTTQHTTPNTKLLRVHCGHRGTYACRGTASSGIYMQRFPIYHLIPFDQGYTELSKHSFHEGGGGDALWV
jgi:hypothetical protein